MIRLNKKQLKNLEKAINKSLLDFSNELGEILVEKEVIPMHSGALQASQKIEPVSENKVQISYPMAYASRVYFGNVDEKASVPITFKYNREYNKHARARWVEEVLHDKNNAALFAEYLQLNLNTLSYTKSDESFTDSETPAAPSKPSWQEQMARAKARDADMFGGENRVVARPTAGGRPARPSGGPMVRPAGPRPKK